MANWKHVTLGAVKAYMKAQNMGWNELARAIGMPLSTVRGWNRKGKAPSEENQLKIEALISGASTTKAAAAKKPAMGTKATSRMTITAPVEIKSRRYERKGAAGAWQVTRISPKAAAERMQEALAQTQVIVSTWHDLPPQKSPVPLLGKDGKAAEGAFTLAAPALKTVREVAVAYIQAHGPKADPKVVGWIVAEILSAAFGEQK